MAAPEATVNVYDVTFDGTTLNRANALTYGVEGTALSKSADNEIFPTIVQVVGKKETCSITTQDITQAMTLKATKLGTKGTLVCKLAALGTGAAQTATIINAVLVSVTTGASHHDASTASYNFECESADGTTGSLTVA